MPKETGFSAAFYVAFNSTLRRIARQILDNKKKKKKENRFNIQRIQFKVREALYRYYTTFAG